MKWLTCVIALVLAGTGSMVHAKSTNPTPEFSGIHHWINTEPLSLSALRGKVVLVDFWAYTCINCIHATPHVEHLYETYKDQGLVVVGVHSPEYDIEKNLGNVRDAVKRLGITYPVAVDSNLATWNAWHNEYWPAEYLIDQNGQLIGHHYGEGDYLRMENAIRLLLGLDLLHGSDASGKPGSDAAGAAEMKRP